MARVMNPATRDRFLTVRWNNALVAGLGLPTLAYATVALSTSALSDRSAFIWLVIIGAVYGIVVEQHSAMRFAWLRSKEGSEQPPLSPVGRLLFIAYNVVWWVPVVLAVVGTQSWRGGFVAFLIFTSFRAVVNLYRTNVLPVEAAQHFPFRSP